MDKSLTIRYVPRSQGTTFLGVEFSAGRPTLESLLSGVLLLAESVRASRGCCNMLWY